jgi:hypothetical protein
MRRLPVLRVAFLVRIQGEATAACDVAEAAALLEEACRLARERGTLLFELRAAVSLLRLSTTSAGDRGRAARAPNLVAETRSRFSEGFETADVAADRILSATAGA